jgi:glycosyltransferase involved in cell wall biosynthesis
LSGSGSRWQWAIPLVVVRLTADVGEVKADSRLGDICCHYRRQLSDLYWRVEAPAKAIGAKTLIVPEKDAHHQFFNPNDDGSFRWKPTEASADYPDVEGVVVWTRPDPIRAVHADAMRHNGHLVISEVDDNYIANPKLNIYTRVNRFTPEMQFEHLTAMASHDRIVFSTEWLRDRYWQEMRKAFPGKRLPEPFVCTNNIDEADWPKPIPRDGPLRVAWMGSHSHVWDVDLAWPALMHAKHNLGCETWLIGYDPAEIHSEAGERSKYKAAQWRKVGAKHIPWRKPADYHRSAIPADIGLCPLVRNDQTLGKSDVKFLEYTISGAAVIAQNNEVYNRTVVHGETGLLVGGPREMLEAVELLVRKPKLRERLVANAQQYVREQRGLKQLREEWGAAIG